MKFLELTLPTPEENLALDEALLEEAEAAASPVEVLRIWEPAETFVVVGRASQVDVEVDRQVCSAQQIGIYRRASGGGTIVAGPGCLMYAVVLSHEYHPEVAKIDAAHRVVLETLAAGLKRLEPSIARQGISDLTLHGSVKFSGNSLRCKRRTLLYHGTLLYDFPLETISGCLKTPPRQPDYRENRTHEAFVANLPVDRQALRQAVIDSWPLDGTLAEWPEELTSKLAREKYASADWNFRL